MASTGRDPLARRNGGRSRAVNTARRLLNWWQAIAPAPRWHNDDGNNMLGKET
jgi:hypothetical protein